MPSMQGTEQPKFMEHAGALGTARPLPVARITRGTVHDLGRRGPPAALPVPPAVHACVGRVRCGFSAAACSPPRLLL